MTVRDPAVSSGRLAAISRRVRAIRFRQVVLWIAIAVVVGFARWRWRQLIGPQTPFIEWDTQVFQQIAELPFGPGLVVSSKPLVVPLVYRAAHNDALAITGFQAEVAFAAWTILTATLALVLRSRWTRVLAICIGLGFLLEPTRVGFATSMMPESINDSLMALTVAGLLAVVRLRRRPRIAAAVATGVLGLTWLFTRDVNLIVALTGTGLAMVIWRGWKSRAAWLVGSSVVVASLVGLWSTTVAHAPLPYQQGWDVAFTPRGTYPLITNLVERMARSDDPADLPAAFHQFPGAMAFVWAAEGRPLHGWVVERGAASYARWLVRHPLDRIAELVASRWHVLGSTLSKSMPGHWVYPAISARKLTSNHWILTLLVLASPVLLRRPRADPMCGLMLCIVVSSAVGAAAAYYGDATELTRHCYGAGQQLVLGLFLAFLAWADRVALARPSAAIGASGSDPLRARSP